MSDLTAVVSYALRLPADGIRILPLAPLAHQSNHLYEAHAGGVVYMVKEFRKADELYDAPAREHFALEALGPRGIAPLPAGWVRAGHLEPGQWPVVVYRRMDGEMWDRRSPTSAEMRDLARLWLAVHEVPVAGAPRARGIADGAGRLLDRLPHILQRYADWARESAPACRPTAEALAIAGARAEAAAAELRRLPVRELYCRADARFSNVIARPDGRLGMVDWEDCGAGDPAQFVADLRIGPNQEDLISPEAWQAFSGLYLGALGRRDPSLARRVALYELLAVMLWLGLMVERVLAEAAAGPVRRWAMNTMPANERGRRFLARALAWPEGDFEAALARIAVYRLFPE
ncbi:MAG TPA: phosphotransferase [Thermoflexales bacterium]|nr:phosphotransferase [Thermoflexales bacterium]